MPDLVDKAESDMSQLINRVGSQAVSKAGQTAMQFSITIAKTATNAPYAAAASIWGAARNAVKTATDTGEVTLKTFTNLANGRREVITLDDAAVSKEFERELKRHGVMWAVDKHEDGSRTFHVQGADSEVVQHALGIAADRVDERLVRGAETQREPEALDATQTTELSETRTSGDSQPSDDAPIVSPNLDSDAAAARADTSPQVSARDQTRRRNADRIDKKVIERKTELAAEKAKTKKRAPGRDAAEAARGGRRG